jgi:hypothetical protein
MTVERLLKPENPPVGHRVQEPQTINSIARTISGGKALKKDLGHRNWNQTIHHLFERRNDIRSSVYREIPTGGSVELDPARLGSYDLRFAGNASISLKKPPRVPPQQGSGRTRWWSIRVRAYYAGEATIGWPSNVYGARDVALTPSADGEYTLEQISALPGNPGAAGTSDVFDLMYDERTGEWFVAWHVRAAATADPSAKDPDAIDPDPAPGEPEQPGSEPGETTDPTDPTDDEYTDPETGNSMTPEQPSAKSGNLVALHDGAVSFSGDCGQWWQLIGGAPVGAVDIATLAGSGAVVHADDGSAFFSRNLQSWSEIELSDDDTIDIPVVNAGFEDGLEGWIGDGAPVSADTVQPPQRDGLRYLTGVDGEVFSVEQEVSVPSGSVSIAVDAWVGSEGSASLTVAKRTAVPTILSNSWSGKVIYGYAQAPDGDLLDLHLVEGNLSTITSNGSGGYKRFEARRQSTGAVYEGVTGITFSDIDGHESVDVPVSEYVGSALPDSSQVYSTQNGSALRFSSPSGVSSGGFVTIYFRTGNMPVEMDALLSVIPVSGPRSWHEDVFDQEVDATVLIDTSGEWSTLAAQFESDGASVIIRLSGDGDAYLDNVRISLQQNESHEAKAICRDLANRRHLLATETAIMSVVNASSVKISDTPISAEHIAAHGDTIVLADAAGQFAISEDNGISWTSYATTNPVRQIFAHPEACAMLDDGTVVKISSASVQECSSQPAGSWITWAARAQKWLLTYPYGTVYSSEDLTTWTKLSDMPVSSQAGFRRIVAADIGRRLSWSEGSRDMFIQDAGNAWFLAPSLAAEIIKIEEIK